MSQEIDAIKRSVGRNKARYLQELGELVRQPSVSTTGEGVSRCAELLASYMRSLGISTRIYPTGGHPVVFGETGPDVGKTLLVYGHYDVQPPDPLDEWQSPPFEPQVRNGKMYGRGTSDNKGQLFAHLKGLEAYRELFGEPPFKIKYIFEGEEEIGSPHFEPFVLEHRDLCEGSVAVFSDSHYHESGRPALILGLKGMLYLELTVRELAGDCHSMKAAALPSAAWRLVTLLSTLKGEDGVVKIEGFYDGVRPPLPEEIEAVESIPCDPEAILKAHGAKKLLVNRSGTDYYYNMAFEPTCNIAGIVSGYTGKGSKTVLPAEARAKIDIRLVPDQTPGDILEKFLDHLRKHGFDDVEVRHEQGFLPSRTMVTDPYVTLARTVVTEVWGQEPVIHPGIGGAGPNYVFTDHLRVPCIVIPFAAADQANHAPNESLDLRGFELGVVTSAAMIRRLGAYWSLLSDGQG